MAVEIFRPLGTYDSPMCRMPCHRVRRECGAFIMLAARDRCALMPSERRMHQRACDRSLVRARAALLHPQLVHHAYRCIALKAKFTLLNCATASVKQRRARPATYICILSRRKCRRVPGFAIHPRELLAIKFISRHAAAIRRRIRVPSISSQSRTLNHLKRVFVKLDVCNIKARLFSNC